jgi:Asp-tRNA(Asn)/Glu-tRNA(Gln) amidotransferase A subunit family amidase
MSERKPNTEEILHRLSEVLDVLKKISEDLQDISKSLRAVSQPAAPTAATTAAPKPPTPKPVSKRIEDIRMMFPEDLEAMLDFEDREDFIKITPRQYLGSENFAKIASAVRDAGGEYVSAGRDSHFRVPT